MSFNKLTDRAVFGATLAVEDLIHVVDVSDTSQSPAGSSYALTLNQLKSFVALNQDLQAVLSNGNQTLGYSIIMSNVGDVITDPTINCYLDVSSGTVSTLVAKDVFYFHYLNLDTIAQAGEFASKGSGLGLNKGYYQTNFDHIDLGVYSDSLGSTTNLHIGAQDANISSTYAFFAGLQYNADYSTNFVARTLIDMGFADANYKRFNYVAVTGTYSVAGSDEFINCTSGTFAVTLPTAVNFKRELTIANSGSGVITLNTTGGQTISGNASGTLTLVQWDTIVLRSDGTNWVKI